MSKGSSNTVQKADPWSGQQPYLTDLYSQAQSQLQAGPQQFYPNKLYADPTQDVIAAEEMARQAALGGQTDLAGDIASATRFGLMSPQNLSNNPYIADAALAALRPLYTQTQGLLQQARRDATGAGQLGGDRQSILESNVIGNYLQRAGDLTSQMYSGAYQDAMKTQQQALLSAPQALQASLAPAQTLGAVGASQQARQQQAIDAARAKFEFEQQAPGRSLSDYANIVAGSMLPATTSISGGDPSLMQKAIGGGLMGAGTYGALSGGMLGGTAGTGFLGMTGGAGMAGMAGPIGLAIGALSLFS